MFMPPSRALTGWTEIEPGAVQRPEEQPGLGVADGARAISAREPHWITDGSSKREEKVGAIGAPKFRPSRKSNFRAERRARRET